MKLINRGLRLFIFMTFSASFGYACSCLGPENAKDGMVAAKAVFSGKVIKASETEWLFEVERVWKGEMVARRAIVRDSMPGTSCSRKFDVGERYIVFASAERERGQIVFYPQICNRTSRVSSAAQTFKDIGRGRLLKRTKRHRKAKSKKEF